jgi:hypothetical protein
MTTRKIYEIWNFGKTRVVPYKRQPIFLQSNWGFETADTEVVKTLKKVPYVSVKFLRTEKVKVAESPSMKNKTASPKKLEASSFGATSATSKKKKNEIIQMMKEVTSNG